jgi:dTDP-glucose 4,6-dehydratase
MRILVAGGAGFIGSNYCRFVLSSNQEDSIVILDALTYAGHLSSIDDIVNNKRISFYVGRIEDQDLVTKLLLDEKVDAIVNFAAETHNDKSLLNVSPFMHSNVLGVQNLLTCVQNYAIPRYVQVSTDEVYGDISEGSWTEESPLLPNTPYSASKAAGDLLCRAFHMTYGTPVIVTRGGNTYGPYQYPEKLISFFAIRLIEGKKVPLYGDGLQVRQWIHVLDHCSAIDLVLRKGSPGEVYNISDPNEKRNYEVVKIILDELGRDSSFIKQIPDPRKGAHDHRYSMYSHKIRALGWRPKVAFDDGLRTTVSWYQKNCSWWKPIVEQKDYQDYVRRFYGPGLGEDL